MTDEAKRWRGLYAITPDTTDDAGLLSAVDRVLRGQPVLLQYRNKCAPPLQRRDQAQEILRRCRAAGVPLIINDDLQLALEIGADGLHGGRDDGDPAVLRAALGRDRILGLTCYADLARARAAVAAGVDYVAFGAMFPSSSKESAPPAPISLLSAARAELSVPVVAIGGITLENAPQLIAAGADLLAVISDVFAADQPEKRAAAYDELFRNVLCRRRTGP